jgi:hypothetical protein
MDAPGGGNADAELLEALRILESHLRGTHRQFEVVKRLMRLRQTRTVPISEQANKR